VQLRPAVHERHLRLTNENRTTRGQLDDRVIGQLIGELAAQSFVAECGRQRIVNQSNNQLPNYPITRLPNFEIAYVANRKLMMSPS
jgi:hypothetical protein